MKNFHTTSTHPVRALKFIGLALLFLLATGTLKGRAQTSNVLFSRPVPDLFPDTPFLCCIIGDFEEPSVHHWKVRLRSSGNVRERVSLSVAATTVNPLEIGSIKATITDENGVQTILVPFLAIQGDNLESRSLDLLPGKIYDLAIERVESLPNPVAHHYKLGSPDKRLELGWEDPLRFLEPPPQAWVVHADQGENVMIDLFKDSPPADTTTQITARLELPNGTVLAGPTTFTPSGTLSIPNFVGGTLVIYTEANGHFRMRKTSGTDQGFYAVPCPPQKPPPNQPPVAKCQDVTVVAKTDSCSAEASINAGSFDPDGDPIRFRQDPPGPYPVGKTLVTLTVTDSKEASDWCRAVVEVLDKTPPKISCTDVFAVADPDKCSTHIKPLILAFDLCGPVKLVCQPPPDSLFPVGVTKVNCTATDPSGNQAFCSFLVQVVDKQPPRIECPKEITRPKDANCQVTVPKIKVFATDNCTPQDELVISQTPPPGTVNGNDFQVVVVTVKDKAGNTSTCFVPLIAKDVTPPTIQCPPDIVVGTDPGQCSAVVTFQPTADDNCFAAALTVVCEPPSGTVFPKGTTTVTCKATDKAGNTSICSFKITVEDREAPVADCRPTVNPSGNNIPTAGENPKSGKNPDGFYELFGLDNCDGANLKIYVKDSAEGPCGGTFAAGPYAPGTKVKLTQSPGQNSVKPMAGEIVAHINTKGEPVLVITDSSGNTVCHKCFVPPPPK